MSQVTGAHGARNSCAQPPDARALLWSLPTDPGLALYLEEPSKAGEPDLHVAIADGEVTRAGVHDTEREGCLPADGQLRTVQVDAYGRRQRVRPIEIWLQLQHTQAQGWQADGY